MEAGYPCILREMFFSPEYWRNGVGITKYILAIINTSAQVRYRFRRHEHFDTLDNQRIRWGSAHRNDINRYY